MKSAQTCQTVYIHIYLYVLWQTNESPTLVTLSTVTASGNYLYFRQRARYSWLLEASYLHRMRPHQRYFLRIDRIHVSTGFCRVFFAVCSIVRLYLTRLPPRVGHYFNPPRAERIVFSDIRKKFFMTPGVQIRWNLYNIFNTY